MKPLTRARLVVVGSLLFTPGPSLSAQVPGPSAGLTEVAPADSLDLLDEMRDRQVEFEHLRESRIPVTTFSGGGGCDVPIGRICIWFGGEEETDFPPEPPETAAARGALIDDLKAAFEAVKDPWILGQLVHYLAESGNLGAAERAAESCGLVDPWWCDALRGYALHLDGRFVEAESAFRRAVANVPPEESRRWTTPRFILTEDEDNRVADLEPQEQARIWELLWRMSDPLFMLEGNDHLTDHYARLVLARNRESAENPHLMQWGEDLEETVVRYGMEIGWSRVIGVPGRVTPTGDPRSTWGHHHPMSRGYLFPEAFLEAPADVLPESWVTAPRESRTWYVAPYAPDFRGLDTQVARFRRGDEMLVIAAYRPTPSERDPFVEAPAPPAPRNPFARSGFGQPDPPPVAAAPAEEVIGPVRAGLFLMPEEAGGSVVSAEGTDLEGVITLDAPAGRYVSSVEVFEPEGERAWRARQGVTQDPMVMGLVALSDLMILREGAPIPDDLEEATPLARPGVRVRSDESFVVAWEVYGLGVDQEVEVTLGFTTGRPAFLSRIGEFLGVLEPEEPVEITFTDAGSPNVQTLFRAIAIELPDLDSGEYTLHLRLDRPGYEPSITSRPIIVIR